MVNFVKVGETDTDYRVRYEEDSSSDDGLDGTRGGRTRQKKIKYFGFDEAEVKRCLLSHDTIINITNSLQIRESVSPLRSAIRAYRRHSSAGGDFRSHTRTNSRTH